MRTSSRIVAVVGLSALALAVGSCKRDCVRDDDCNDNLFCNGIERCRPTYENADEQGCVSSGAGGCLAGQYCFEIGDRCVTPCGNILRDADGNARFDTEGQLMTDRIDDRDHDGTTDVACGGVDCDDLDPNRYPSKPEICDPLGHDEDCNDETWGALDRDGDGHLDARCFLAGPDGGPAVRGIAPDGGIRGIYGGTDCDDFNGSVYPLAGEICNGRDDDCDGVVDEGELIPLMVDADGDGFGVPNSQTEVCIAARGYSAFGGDCNDANPQIYPGSLVCDVGGQGNTYRLCKLDGSGWLNGTCPAAQVCIAQPGGHGVCS